MFKGKDKILHVGMSPAESYPLYWANLVWNSFSSPDGLRSGCSSGNHAPVVKYGRVT
jgi:hypothetical protein